jgi:hypothetical protein
LTRRVSSRISHYWKLGLCVTLALSTLVLFLISATAGAQTANDRRIVPLVAVVADTTPEPMSEALAAALPSEPEQTSAYVRPNTPTAAVSVTTASRFTWPAAGPITSYFGAGHPTGIDIALDLNSDSPVSAASDGRVTFAGGDACCEYGLYVVLEHDGGFETLYGHLSRVDAKVGDAVRQGQVLGLGGATGKADGKHLHFELLRDNQWVDPFLFLPALGAKLPASEQIACPGRDIETGPDSLTMLEVSSEEFPGLWFEEADIDGRPVDAEVIGSLVHVRFAAPALTKATGSSSLSTVSFKFGTSQGLSEAVSCVVRVSSNKTLANVIVPRQEPLTRALSSSPAAPMTPTRTPTPLPPTPTPTPITLYVVLTPRPSSTPKAPVSFSEDAPPRQVTATPRPATSTPTPKPKGVRFD